MNQFKIAKERQERESAAVYDATIKGRMAAHDDGFAKGVSVGIDTGRTEALNEVSDRIDSSSLCTRVSKARLKAHVIKRA